jgi:hypothetical protein
LGGGSAEHISGWRHESKFSVDDLGFAISGHVIEVFDGDLGLGWHFRASAQS